MISLDLLDLADDKNENFALALIQDEEKRSLLTAHEQG
jgi:hypothetical protein